MWAIDPRALPDIRRKLANIPPETMADLIAGRIAKPAAMTLFSAETEGEREACYRMLDDGTAVVSVSGPLYPDSAPWFRVWLTDGTTYGMVLGAVREALADSFSTRVVIECDSPGGQVAGVVEAAAGLRALKGAKPIEAHAVGPLASACYWLMSACDRITASPTAGVGSIGVVMTLMDDSKSLAMEGVDRYVVVNGDSPRKRPDLAAADGLDDYRAEVDAVFDAFVADVAAGRGVDDAWVRESMGRGACLVGAAALEAKLIDALSVGIPPKAPEESEADLEVTHSQPGLLPAATHLEVYPMAEKAQAAVQSTADPREAQILALITERDALADAAAAFAAKCAALESTNAALSVRVGEYDAAAKAAAEAQRLATRDAMLDGEAKRCGPSFPRALIADAYDRVGAEYATQLAATFPSAGGLPRQMVGQAGAPVVAGSRADLDATIKTQAAAWGVDYDAAYARLGVERPDLFKTGGAA